MRGGEENSAKGAIATKRGGVKNCVACARRKGEKSACSLMKRGEGEPGKIVSGIQDHREGGTF